MLLQLPPPVADDNCISLPLTISKQFFDSILLEYSIDVSFFKLVDTPLPLPRPFCPSIMEVQPIIPVELMCPGSAQVQQQRRRCRLPRVEPQSDDEVSGVDEFRDELCSMMLLKNLLRKRRNMRKHPFFSDVPCFSLNGLLAWMVSS